MRDPHLHFWTLDPAADDVLDWNPDTDPGRHQSGLGHALFELATRLNRAGYTCTIGSEAPEGAVAVAYLGELHGWRNGLWNVDALTRFAPALRTAHAAVIIRGDVPLRASLAMPGIVEIAPNPSAVDNPHRSWIPLLPQRGLIPRDPSREPTIGSLGLMANAENLPPALADPSWTDRLAGLGVLWRPVLRERTPAPGSPAPAWHDFGTLDAVIGLRNESPEAADRKPPTKLINAWVAGAIPLMPPERNVLDLAIPGVDTIMADSVDDVLRCVASLNNDPSRCVQLRRAIQTRGVGFSTELVLERWRGLFERLAATPPAADLPHATRRIESLVRTIRMHRKAQRLGRGVHRRVRTTT